MADSAFSADREAFRRSVATANRPFHHLVDLTPVLWQPALVCSSGAATHRLRDLPSWEQALQAGHLPEAGRHWCDPAACIAIRAIIIELELCKLTQGSAAMTRQLLSVMLWHLDRIAGRPSSESRPAAIQRTAQAFRAEWDTQREDWEQVLALFQSLGDLANLRWDSLQGRLQSRGWSEAHRPPARPPAGTGAFHRWGRARAAVRRPACGGGSKALR